MSAAANPIQWNAATTLSFERQWAALRQPAPPARAGHGNGEAPETDQDGRVLTLNLIIRASDAADAEFMAGCVWELGPRHPARAFLVIPQAQGGSRLRVAAQAQGAEMLEIALAPERAASVVTPLLQSDLPTVLIWRGASPLGNPEFQHWAAMADRVLIDAHQLHLNLDQLAALAQELPRTARLTDLTWTRLTPWRQLLCQGLEVHPGSAGQITRVVIGPGHPGKSQATDGEHTGELAAALLAGWLAHQLGWVPQQRLSPQHLRMARPQAASTGAQPGAAVQLEFEPAPEQIDSPRGRLLRHFGVEINPDISVEIQHHGPHLSLSVRNAGEVIGHWAGATAPNHRSDPDLLCEELSVYGSDPLFLEALESGRSILSCLQRKTA